MRGIDARFSGLFAPSLNVAPTRLREARLRAKDVQPYCRPSHKTGLTLDVRAPRKRPAVPSRRGGRGGNSRRSRCGDPRLLRTGMATTATTTTSATAIADATSTTRAGAGSFHPHSRRRVIWRVCAPREIRVVAGRSHSSLCARYALIILYDVFFGNGLCGLTITCSSSPWG